jgi:D-3-phosphoglycerate dehydrogenase
MSQKKILANDGIDPAGKKLLEQAGFEVHTDKVKQEELAGYVQTHHIGVLTVRSATQVRKELIDACSGLKIIARGGVGMDNIDVEYARSKGKHVLNTPAASSHSVAELVMAHLYSMVRSLAQSNREMAAGAGTSFEGLKKRYSASGIEVRGKTLGIIGFGRIGQSLASVALGNGMRVMAYDPFVQEALIDIPVHGHEGQVKVKLGTGALEDIFRQSDFISVHVPGGKLIGTAEIGLMKEGVMLVNASRGGVIDEQDLLDALNSGKVGMAALDVFMNEPQPSPALLKHPNVSLSPHIGASTKEAQERVGTELAQLIIHHWEH